MPNAFALLIKRNMFPQMWDWLSTSLSTLHYYLVHRHFIAKIRLCQANRHITSDADNLDRHIQQLDDLSKELNNVVSSSSKPKGNWYSVSSHLYGQPVNSACYWRVHVEILQKKCLAVFSKEVERIELEVKTGNSINLQQTPFRRKLKVVAIMNTLARLMPLEGAIAERYWVLRKQHFELVIGNGQQTNTIRVQ